MRVAITPNGPYAYVTNNGSGTISSYAVQKYGKLLGSGGHGDIRAGPIDAAIAGSGRHLFVLNSVSQSISSFSVGRDSRLTNPGSVANLPVGANGLAAN